MTRSAILAKEISCIANLSKDLGYLLGKENRLMTKEEAYRQISFSASLFKGALEYVEEVLKDGS